VDAAESSPAAATAAAYQIRKFLSKDNVSRPHVQYNAIMLVRILSDNPGPGFTNNIDEKFRLTIKSLLRLSRDPSVQQILRETLNSMEVEKAQDENLRPLLSMWRKEKGMVRQGQVGNGYRQYPTANAQTVNPPMSSDGSSPRRPQENHLAESPARDRGQLPGPEELASRIEEARNSAKLLMQLTQSTPASEFLSHDLIKEFAERCQSAQGNLQGYMNSTHPPPDEQTFQTLIETCEQLSVALSKHQRAMLAARRESAMAAASGYGQSMGTASTPPPSFNMQAKLQRSAIPLTTSAFLTDPPRGDPFSDDHQLHSSDLSAVLALPRITDQSYNYGRAPSPMPGTVELPAEERTPPLPDPSAPGSITGQIPVHAGYSMKGTSVFEPIRAPLAGRHPTVSHSAHNSDASQYDGAPITTRQSQTKNNTNNAAKGSNHRHLSPDTPESLWSSQQYQQGQPPLQSTSTSKDIPFPQGIQELHATPSYITRQDVAVEKHVMSGGASSPPSARNPVSKFSPPPLNFSPSRIPPIPTTPSASGTRTPPSITRPYWEQQQSPKTNRRPRRTSADYEGKGWGDEDESPERHRAARIKDDDPVTPMTPVGGSSWRHYGSG